MQTQSCPAAATLHEFLLGRLSIEDSGSLDDHLIQCDRCAERAGDLRATDEIVEAIAATKICDSGFEGIEDLVERGKQIFRDTRVLAGDETFDPVARDPAEYSKWKLDPSSCSFLQPAEELDEIGRFGDYRILSVLGSGGMGVVFLAEELSLRRQVALKVIKQGANKHTHARFLREARALAAVESDHIVTIHRVGEVDDVPFLEMPVLRGESLEQCLRRQERLSVLEVCKLGEQAALGLAAAHDRGLLHRDIKPGNIWLAAPDWRVKILDFGLVRQDDEPELTKLGTVVGTPQYMSPEQTRGDHIDHRTDLFSLGSVLYHATTGETPFKGSSVVATLVEVASVEAKPMSELRADVPDQLAELIMLLLSKDPNRRPQSADILAKQFAAIRHDLAITAVAPTRTANTVETEQECKIASSQAEGSPSRTRIPRKVYTAIAAVACGVLAVFATIVLQWDVGTGIVHVKIDSADQLVKLDITKDSLKIVDPNDGKIIQVTVDQEASMLRLEKEGFSAVTKQFEVTGTDGQIISARFVPKTSTVDHSKRDAQPSIIPDEVASNERRIAHWVIQHGGAVGTVDDGGTDGRFHDRIEDLPSSPFICSAVGFSGKLGCAEEELAILNELVPENILPYQPGVLILLTGLPITGACFKELAKIQQLESVRFDFCSSIESSNVLHFQGKPLESFFALQSNLGDELASLVAQTPTLEHVAFGTELTGQGIQALAGSSHVEIIGLWGCIRLTPQDFEPLGELPNLKELQIGTGHASDVAYQEKLRSLTQITTLRIHKDDDAPLTALEFLSEFKHIETLDLSYMRLAGLDMSPLREMPKLTMLLVRSSELSTDSIEQLRTLIPNCEIVFE